MRRKLGVGRGIAMSAVAPRPSFHLDQEQLAYRAFLDSLPFILWLTDPSGRCLFENNAALEFTGCRLEQVLGDGWTAHVHPDDVRQIQIERDKHFCRAEHWQTEMRHRRRDGEYRWFLATMVPFTNLHGEFLGYVGAFTDIHGERTRATTGRAADLARANEALKQTLDVIATEPDMDGVLGHVLRVITQILGGIASTLWLKDREGETAQLHLVYADGRLVSGPDSDHRLAGQSLSIQRNDLFALEVFRHGRPVWHEVESSDALDETAREYLAAQGAKGLLGVPLILRETCLGSIVVRFADKRDFGDVEIELAQGLAQQATLALQLTRLAEQARKAAITEERNRMAREIHDTLAQGFTGILVQLQAAKQVLNGTNPDVKSHLDSATSLARQGLTEARRSVQGLRPQLLRGGDILTALNRLVRQLSGESLMQIRLEVHGEARSMSSDMESNLLRITQEAVTNAIKHSGGNRVQVKLDLESDVVKLMIEDNGDGFDPHESALGRGFGLISIQERADRIGADLTILTKPGAGTKIHLLAPLAPPRKSGAAHS